MHINHCIPSDYRTENFIFKKFAAQEEHFIPIKRNLIFSSYSSLKSKMLFFGCSFNFFISLINFKNCVKDHFFFWMRRSNRRSDWDDNSRTAPLATPETLSEASSSPPSPVPPPRPMRRTPKISGNLSTAADDLKNNLHFAMLSAKNYFLREGNNGSNTSSGNSEASYESAKSLTAGLPPPVPRRRDSVIVRR